MKNDLSEEPSVSSSGLFILEMESVGSYKRQQISTRLHGFTTQKVVFFSQSLPWEPQISIVKM
jgi:hypothetical protein